MELTRKQVIEILEKADSTVYKEPKTKTAQALEYAINYLKTDEKEFHCGIEESGGHAYNCGDCPNKCDVYYQWDKEMKAK